MPIYNIHLTTPIRRTFRTEQVAGLFDLALDELAEERLAHTLTAELPGLDEDWTIGAIVGPSGSGKTTLARAAYGAAVVEPREWPEDEAIIDALESRSRLPGGTSTGEATSLGDSRSRPAGGTYPLKHLLRVLAAVGLASPPSWLKPYHVLSTGERFRADLARAILASGVREHPDGVASATNPRYREADASRSPLPLLVFDEFTSTLDRTVACTASFALAKFLRSSDSNPKAQIQNPKFICLSCHTDFLPWLRPDWILDLANEESGRGGERERGRSAKPSHSTRPPLSPSPTLPLIFRPFWPRGSLQRPRLRLRVRRVRQRLWPRFARHHYLSGGLSTAATCYAAFADSVQSSKFNVQSCEDIPTLNFEPGTLNLSRPIAFCAVLATLGWKRTKRITRLVVLPEFQGLGIGPRLAETVAAAEVAKGNRVTITASHPSVLAWCSRSPRWRYLGLKKTGSTRQRLANRTIRCSSGRAVASYEWVGVSGEW